MGPPSGSRKNEWARAPASHEKLAPLTRTLVPITRKGVSAPGPDRGPVRVGCEPPATDEPSLPAARFPFQSYRARHGAEDTQTAEYAVVGVLAGGSVQAQPAGRDRGRLASSTFLRTFNSKTSKQESAGRKGPKEQSLEKETGGSCHLRVVEWTAPSLPGLPGPLCTPDGQHMGADWASRWSLPSVPGARSRSVPGSVPSGANLSGYQGLRRDLQSSVLQDRKKTFPSTMKAGGVFNHTWLCGSPRGCRLSAPQPREDPARAGVDAAAEAPARRQGVLAGTAAVSTRGAGPTSELRGPWKSRGGSFPQNSRGTPAGVGQENAFSASGL